MEKTNGAGKQRLVVSLMGLLTVVVLGLTAWWWIARSRSQATAILDPGPVAVEIQEQGSSEKKSGVIMVGKDGSMSARISTNEPPDPTKPVTIQLPNGGKVVMKPVPGGGQGTFENRK